MNYQHLAVGFCALIASYYLLKRSFSAFRSKKCTKGCAGACAETSNTSE